MLWSIPDFRVQPGGAEHAAPGGALGDGMGWSIK